MTIRCPLCGEVCESDADIPVGEQLECPFCGNSFSYGPGCLLNGVASSQKDELHLQEMRKPKMPGLTLAGHIIFYAFWGCSLCSAIGRLPGTPLQFVLLNIGWPCLLIACTITSRRGKNWARITLTFLVVGIVLLGFAVNPVVGVIFMIMFALPVVFIWLPCSNNWYRQVKAMTKASK